MKDFIKSNNFPKAFLKQAVLILTIAVLSSALVSCENPWMIDVLDPLFNLTINFNSNGGSSVDPVKVERGNEILMQPETEKQGYFFGGWFTSLGFSERVVFPYTAMASTTLHAKWNLTEDTYGISLTGFSGSSYTFHEITFGETSDEELNVTIKNTGNQPTGSLIISLSGTGASAFTLSKTAISSLEPDTEDSFTVKTTPNLEAGTYAAVVTVSNSANGISEYFNISFTVNPQAVIDPQPITNVEITVTAPVTDGTPAVSNGISIPSSSNYSITSAVWLVGNTQLELGAVFAASTAYTIRLTLTANTNYTFTGLSTHTVNGNSAEQSNNTGETVVLSYTFAATEVVLISGSGTEENPYQIESGEALLLIGTGNYGLDKYYELTADITLPVPGPDGNNWTPIGLRSDGYRFSGHFNGNNNTISGLTITGDGTDQGLFASIGNDGIVENVILTDVSINLTYNAANTYAYIGSIAGENLGTIINCHVTGNIITDGEVIGGIAGASYGNIENCSFEGYVKGVNTVGGIVGDISNDSTVQNSFFNGISEGGRNGGIAGSNNGIIENCYALGEIKDHYFIEYDMGNGELGGIVGLNHGKVLNCYAENTISGSGQIGGIVGRTIGGTVENCVALNKDIISWDYNDIGRIIGLIQGVPEQNHNYARIDMEIRNTDSTQIYDPISGLVTKDGEDTDSFMEEDFWAEFETPWDFTDIWIWNADISRPVLR